MFLEKEFEIEESDTLTEETLEKNLTTSFFRLFTTCRNYDTIALLKQITLTKEEDIDEFHC